MPPTLLITGRATPELVAQIHAVAPDARVLTRAELDAHPDLLGTVEIVYGRLDPALFPRATGLRWLQTDFAGMEWATAPEVQAHPAVLTNARIHAAPISEHLFGLLLMLTRRLDRALDCQRAGHWAHGDFNDADALAGKTLCVVGLGVIGRRCAALGRAFGMRAIGVRRHAEPVAEVDTVFTDDRLHDALAQADVVMDLLPNTPATRHTFDTAAFAAMRAGSYFLNAGRGQTVDTDALLHALRHGPLRAAALDVTAPEPLPDGHPLWTQPNVLITPHFAGLFPGYAEAAAAVFLTNLRHYLAGEPLEFVVGKEAGY